MKEKKIYSIYALIFGDVVFVGKTTSHCLSAVYRRHRRGEVQATKYFSISGIKPALHILARDEMEPFEAYRWIVGCVFIFREAGYEILNSTKTIEHSRDLHPETKCLVDYIARENVDDLLQKTLVQKPSDADFCINKEIELRPACEKLTVRISKWEKERLDCFAQKMHMTQRQMIQFLISFYEMQESVFPDWEKDVYVRAMMGALREENAKLRKENEKNKKHTSQWRSKSGQDGKYENLTRAISLYSSFMESAHPILLAVERKEYKNYPGVEEYVYPQKPGIYIVRVTAVLTGKGRYPAKFVLGTDENGLLFKFRYYPKKDFVGITPNNDTFMLRGSVWLFGCEEAPDGAMDLVFAFPLAVRSTDRPQQISDATGKEDFS